MTHSGAAGENRPNLTFCSVADMSLKMERHRQRTQPFWKTPLRVLGIVICLCLGFMFLAYWSGQKASSNASSAFLRGFPTTHFLDFGLCRRSRILVAILALCLCIQKFRSRQPGFEHEVGPHCTRNSDFWAAVIRIGKMKG